MSRDTLQERYNNARAHVKHCMEALAEAENLVHRVAAQMPSGRVTDKRPERWWQARGYEFPYCGRCGHRYFNGDMVPEVLARRGNCHYCLDDPEVHAESTEP